MYLTDTEKRTLRQRYEDWGLDTVREDLRKPFRHIFVSRERNEFAKNWVDETEVAQERRRVRSKRLARIMLLAAIIEVGVAVGLQLDLPF